MAESTAETQASAATNAPVWSGSTEVEEVEGTPFRMYPVRPTHLDEVLPLARRWGERAYVVQGDEVVTFTDLVQRAHDQAEGLRAAGVHRGDRVLLLGWNSPAWVVNFWACQVAGAVPILANAWWSPTEVRDAVDLLAPAAALVDDRGATLAPAELTRAPWAGSEATAPSRPVDPERPNRAESDAAVIIFTSGTSGTPKAVELSHRSLLANLQMLLGLSHRLPHEVTDSSGEVALHTGPLFHVGGPQNLLRSVAVGNTLVLPAGRFDPGDILSLVERHRITRWSAVPTMVTRVLDHPDVRSRDLTSLKSLTIGGSPIHGDLLRRIGQELPAVKAGVPTGYGLTENGGQATAASGRDTLQHPGSAGRPLPVAEVSFEAVDGLPDPEVLLRAATQMTRYIGTDESPIDGDGWLHTGDLGHLDDDGRLWITGRAKDLIIRGGENIAPAAVEQALASLDGVSEVAVIGVPHADLGEEVCAFVVVSDDGLDAVTLAGAVRGQVASFAVPSVWYLETSPLPTNQTGKVDKPALVARAAEHADRAASAQ